MTSTNSQPAADAGATGDGALRSTVLTFLEQLDHDLRTPLGTMAAAVELMRVEQPGSASHAETLAMLQRQIGRIHSLTETLRDFSQGLARRPARADVDNHANSNVLGPVVADPGADTPDGRQYNVGSEG